MIINLMSIFLLLFSYQFCTARQEISQLLFESEPQSNGSYYDILPMSVNEKSHIKFMRSRDPKNMSLEKNFIRMIAKATAAEVIVETGTYKGDTTEKMAAHFKEVHTIELSKELYEQAAKKRFKDNKNVYCYHGDSAQLLPRILKQLKSRAIFFLDAHFSMGDTAQGDENTPILTELNLIKDAGITNAIIIIDDIRMFYKPTHNLQNTFAAGYPSVQDLVEKIITINSSYQIAIVYDTLIAFPAADKITVSPIVKAATMSRLYDGHNYAIEDVLRAELDLSKANGKEKDAIVDLCTRWIEPWSTGTRISSHYALWYGLILMQDEEYGKAAACFADAKKRGLYHWRIDWYCAMAQATCFFDISS